MLKSPLSYVKVIEPLSSTFPFIIYCVDLVLLEHFVSPIVIPVCVNASATEPAAVSVVIEPALAVTVILNVSPFAKGFAASGSAAYT